MRAGYKHKGPQPPTALHKNFLRNDLARCGPLRGVKVLIAVFVVATGFVMSIPLLFANGASATPPYACGQLGVILDTIRTRESGGDYTAHAAKGSAAGAYQYVTGTWKHWADQAEISADLYPTADSAPPHIQDQVAGVNVTSILADHNNLVEAVPVIWYYPIAWDNDTIMDQVPAPQFGNTLTVREYQTGWLKLFNSKLATPQQADTMLCANTDVTGQWALPAPRSMIGEDTLDDPHHDYPAWDFTIPVGTAIYAVTAGTVANIGTWPGNWWNAGCNSPNRPPACSTCGIGITIQHPDGLRHTYCHNSVAHVAQGDIVAPGQHIADSGNSGRSGEPHLHLELRINNVRYCPQPLMTALYFGTPIPTPESLPTSGCSF